MDDDTVLWFLRDRRMDAQAAAGADVAIAIACIVRCGSTSPAGVSRPQTPMNQITDNLPRTAASAREYPGRYGLIVGLITGRSPAPPLGERKSKNLRDRASFAFLDLDGWIKTLSLSLQPSHAISRDQPEFAAVLEEHVPAGLAGVDADAVCGSGARGMRRGSAWCEGTAGKFRFE